MLTKEEEARVCAAINLIAATPGFAGVAVNLNARLEAGRIRFLPNLSDRGQATLTGAILLGPEAMYASPLGLAETLVHEHHHLHQFPLLKSLSFWSGVVTATPVMRRYERPAYEASLRFLQAVIEAFPALAVEAREETYAISRVFDINFGEPLF